MALDKILDGRAFPKLHIASAPKLMSNVLGEASSDHRSVELNALTRIGLVNWSSKDRHWFQVRVFAIGFDEGSDPAANLQLSF